MKTWRDCKLKWLPLSEGTDFESPNTFSEARPEASAALFKVDTLAAANNGDQIDLWEHSHDLYFSVLMLWSLYPDYAKQMSHSCIAKRQTNCICIAARIKLSRVSQTRTMIHFHSATRGLSV